mmetsp:Transcript_14609/g.31657  ORF Transcript_14609/g.31657 Transcript_14609/m.31657 type:complete len:82 (-) Transcript_14609:523-768(-)
MAIRVVFFAAARDIAGISEVQFELAECVDSNALRAKLLSCYADLEQLLPQCAFACNSVYVTGTCVFADGDEVAVLPPVSGG